MTDRYSDSYSDIVFLRGLQVETRIGVYDWEREQLRPLILDLEFGLSLNDAAANDDVSRTVDYAAVAQQISEFARAREDLLLETFAEKLLAELLHKWPANFIDLTIHKPGAVPGANVGIRLRRQRKQIPQAARAAIPVAC